MKHRYPSFKAMIALLFFSVTITASAKEFTPCAANGLVDGHIVHSTDISNLAELGEWLAIMPIDTIAPILTVADDVTIQCGEDLPAPDFTVDDACGSVHVDVSPEVTPGCGQTYTMVRTYTATDDCGNVSTETQTLMVVDTIAPVIELSGPAALELECSDFACGIDQVMAYQNGTLGGTETEDFLDCVRAIFMDNSLIPSGVSDECSDDLDFFETGINVVGHMDCGPNGERALLECIFGAEDDCGNQASLTTSVTVVDNEGPEFLLPGASTLQLSCEEFDCGLEEAQNFQNGTLDSTGTSAFLDCIRGLFMDNDLVPTGAIDGCTGEAIAFEEIGVSVTVNADCGASGEKARFECVFAAMDACGNTSELVTSIDVVDITAPELILPAVESIELGCTGFLCGFDVAADYDAGLLDSAASADFISCLEQQFLQFGLVPQGVTDNCSEELEWAEDSVTVEIVGGCGQQLDGSPVAIFRCYFSAEDDCGNTTEPYHTIITLVDEVPADDCTVSDSAPVQLKNSKPSINGVYDRVVLKWFKDTPRVRYQPEDSAACDIQFLAVKDLETNTWIMNADTGFVGKDIIRNPGGELYKFPLFFSRDDIQPNTLYGWRVRCYCSDGEGPVSPWSNPRTFRTPGFDPLTGILDPNHSVVDGGTDPVLRSNGIESDELVMTLFPNPANELINIALETEVELGTVLSIRDVLGKEVYRKEIDVEGERFIRVDAKDFPSGGYVVQLISGGRMTIEQLIINR